MQTTPISQASAKRAERFVALALTPLLLVCGCQTQTQTGALVGAGVGGVLGAIVGRATHNTAAGAVVGTALGATVGAAAGSEADARAHAAAVQQDVVARGGPLSLEQVRDLVQSNVADAVIIDQIRLTRSVYQLTPDQIVWLKQVGVSDTVIYAMQETASYRGPRRVVVVEQAPPVVGIGFGYGRRW